MSSVEGMMPPSAAAASATEAAPPRRRLFRKYALLFIGLVGAALLVTSGFDFWFSYQETKAALLRLQQEKALAAAERIEGFIEEIERQIGWTTHAQWAGAPLDQRRQDYFRLLRQVPAITEVRQLDAAGREQLKVSRLAMDAVGSTEDLSQNPAFLGAKAGRLWFSPVYFRKQSEPYVTMAIVHQGRNAGVTIAEINLKLIWDVITGLKIGQSGYAYIVDGTGRLIAHPDISLVLRGSDLSGLSQVAAALTPGTGREDRGDAVVVENLTGKPVLSAHAPIAPLGWTVFVEAPLSEAFAPLYGAAWRTLLLLIGGLGVAILLALLLARRMTGPIHAIAEGAERFGAGEFGRRIEVNTGDELEALAGQFNRMAGDLQRSYAELEQRVADRTAELSEALEQQTATAEVLQVINSSPGDLVPVFDAMLEKALRLCEAVFGSLLRFDGQFFHRAAIRNFPPYLAERNQPIPPFPGSALRRLTEGEPFAMIEDITVDAVTRAGDPGRLAMARAGARTAIWVALRKDDTLLGAFVAYRQEVKPFSDKQIALMRNFAAQAVIAIENARLINETREALEQQTATAEVLQVINASPGDLAPVFEAILAKAMELCDAAFGIMAAQGGQLRPVATRGVPPAYEEFVKHNPPQPGQPGIAARIRSGEPFVHVVDLKDDDLYRSGDRQRRAMVDLGGARSSLIVGLRKDRDLLGGIQIYRQEVRPFTDKQIALLQNFAAQAVIAMENARLITETREALEQQTATAEVLQVINSSPGDLAPVFDAVLEKAHQLCGASFGALMRFDGERFYSVAVQGVPEEFRRFIGDGIRPVSGNPFARVVEGEPFSHIDDLSEIATAFPDDPLPRAAVDLGGIRSFLIVPLRKDGTLLGVITAYRQEVRPFTDKQIALLQNFAAQAVIAMENARLISETRAARDASEKALSDLKAAQSSLLHAQKMSALGQLTAGIAHEIKNPLNFVNNFATLSNELLVELKEMAAPALDTLDTDTRADIDETIDMLSGNLTKIAEHGKRADNIVKSMLAHSRGASGERTQTNLNALVDEALNLAYHGARASDQNFNITMERDFAAALAPVEMVPQDMMRVFLNLIGNGFHAAQQRRTQAADPGFRPVLTVVTRDLGDAVEIKVRDNGTGIPPEHRDRLFQPFFTTKPTGEGTGLGLSISYDIVTQEHGGTITAESEPGMFTEFTVRLPKSASAHSAGTATGRAA